MKIVKVEWEDITCQHGWSDLDRVDNTIIISSVGYLLSKDKKYLRITPSISIDNNSKTESLVIPMGVVKKIKVIGKL